MKRTLRILTGLALLACAGCYGPMRENCLRQGYGADYCSALVVQQQEQDSAAVNTVFNAALVGAFAPPSVDCRTVCNSQFTNCHTVCR